jgi:hypothetical protein
MSGTVCTRYGQRLEGIKVVLGHVSYTQESKFNSFRVNVCLKNGWEFNKEYDDVISIEKGDMKIIFDVVMMINEKKFYGIRFERERSQQTKVARFYDSEDDDISK